MSERDWAGAAAQWPLQRLASRLLDEQRARWERGDEAPAEEFLRQHLELQADPEALVDLICQEVLLQQEHGRVARRTEGAGLRRPPRPGRFQKAAGRAGGESGAESHAKKLIAPSGDQKPKTNGERSDPAEWCTQTDEDLARCGPPPVCRTSARIAMPPICCGHIDLRTHTKILSALRADTPA
jgi:hypothetical protein